MACEFLYNPIQTVALNAPILFDTSIPCSKGYVYHEGNTGNFILKGANSNNPCNLTVYYSTALKFDSLEEAKKFLKTIKIKTQFKPNIKEIRA